MTRPTDAAIARAFDRALLTFDTSMPWSIVCQRMKEWAAEFDAESPAGTGCKVCGGGNVYCAACMSKSAPGVTTSPERVQIPAESKRTCTCPSGDGSLRWPCPKHPHTEFGP